MRMLVVAALAATSLAGPANAAITIYTSQAAFNAATSGQGVDTFNDLSPGDPFNSPVNRTAGTYGYTITDSGGTLYGAGSAADAWLSNDSNTSTITFSGFTGGASAIGANFFGSDISGQFAAAPLGLTITVTDADGTVTQTLISPTQSTFLGFVSTGGLSQLTLQATVPSSSYWATANNLTIAAGAVAGVPEPATWAMMMLGFGLVGGVMRRRVAKVNFAAA